MLLVNAYKPKNDGFPYFRFVILLPIILIFYVYAYRCPRRAPSARVLFSRLRLIVINNIRMMSSRIFIKCINNFTVVVGDTSSRIQKSGKQTGKIEERVGRKSYESYWKQVPVDSLPLPLRVARSQPKTRDVVS